MPRATPKKRQRRHGPTDPWLLRQAVYWLAYGDPNPRSPILDYYMEKAFLSANVLVEWLRAANIKAYGRLTRCGANTDLTIEREPIDPERWQNDWCSWSSNLLSVPPDLEYRDIVLSRAKLLRTEGHPPEGPPIAAGRPGRPREHDRERFWKLAVLVASVHGGLPESQAEFIKQMEEALSLMSPDGEGLPGSTWMKACARELYLLREEFSQKTNDNDAKDAD